MSDLLLMLSALACAGLIGLGFSSLLIVRLHAEGQKLRGRIAAATHPYLPAEEAAATRLFRRAGNNRTQQLARWAGSIIGFDPVRRDQYPLPWWLVAAVAVVLARGAAGLLGGLLGTLSLAVVPFGTIAICRFFFGWCRNRRSRTLFHQMPDALAMIVRSVRVGIPMGEAIRTVAREAAVPTSVEFSQLANRVVIGVPLDEALREMADRNDLAEYRFFATALTLQSQTGGGLTETLENLAEVIRKRVALRARAHALASEARTSAGILVALPVFSAIALYFLNRTYTMQLFIDPSGRKILAMAVLSLGFGLMVMRSIIQKSLS